MVLSRREFLKANAVATVSLAAKKHGLGPRRSFDNPKPVRVGVVGTGSRGRGLLGILLDINDVEIPALCDIDTDHLVMAQDMVVKSGRAKPEAYSKDEYIFQKLMDRDDIDAVIIATYWEWHTPMAVYGMKAGKYVGVEVPAAYTLEECWELVDTYEATRIPCMMFENWPFWTWSGRVYWERSSTATAPIPTIVSTTGSSTRIPGRIDGLPNICFITTGTNTPLTSSALSSVGWISVAATISIASPRLPPIVTA
jgi:hypothetical protein